MKPTNPYLRDIPLIPGRPLIEGRSEPDFPDYVRLEEKPVTFREGRGISSREERENHCIDWIVRARRAGHRVILMIPHGLYADPQHAVFLCGWTLWEEDGEVRTRQCVVFFRDDVLPIGTSDQGVLCVADPERLSAWNGLTSETSRALAA